MSLNVILIPSELSIVARFCSFRLTDSEFIALRNCPGRYRTDVTTPEIDYMNIEDAKKDAHLDMDSVWRNDMCNLGHFPVCRRNEETGRLRNLSPRISKEP
jgi:hypothetical protein